MEDLSQALRDYGITVAKPPYYADAGVVAEKPAAASSTAATSTSATSTNAGAASQPRQQ